MKDGILISKEDVRNWLIKFGDDIKMCRHKWIITKRVIYKKNSGKYPFNKNEKVICYTFDLERICPRCKQVQWHHPGHCGIMIDGAPSWKNGSIPRNEINGYYLFGDHSEYDIEVLNLVSFEDAIQQYEERNKPKEKMMNYCPYCGNKLKKNKCKTHGKI